MKSIYYELEAPFQLVPKEMELDPRQLKETQILAETEYSALSPGTECAAWLGKPPLRPTGKVYPRLMGYCNLARVIQVGERVSTVAVGDLILTHQSHRAGFICESSEVLLRFTDRELPSEAMKMRITTAHLFHQGYASLLSGGYQPGHLVAILGMGTLGVAAAALARAFGSQPFLFTDQPSSRTFLKEKRFSRVYPKEVPKGDFENHLIGMGGVDITLNTSNQWPDHLLALQLTRVGGTIICLGFPGRGEPQPDFNPLDSQYLWNKHLTIKHNGGGGQMDVPPIDVRFTVKRNLAYLSHLILAGDIDPMDILSIQTSWKDLGTLYKTLASREPGLYTGILKWKE